MAWVWGRDRGIYETRPERLRPVDISGSWEGNWYPVDLIFWVVKKDIQEGLFLKAPKD